MRQEAWHTTHGEAPGKPTWRDTVAKNIGIKAKAVTADRISVDVGYSPDSQVDEVRAMIVAYGSGDKAGSGGKPIRAGPTGRSVWNDKLDGKHPSHAQHEYPLPDAFNQAGNQFIADAMHRMRTQFGDRIKQAFRDTPEDMVATKVRVKQR